MMKKLLSLSVLIAMLWGCCTVEDTPKTEEKDKPVNYKVTFDANGGKGKMPQQIFVADTSQPLNPNTFKRVGYVFTEWNTEADGNGVTYMSGSYYSLTSDITLYAQWEAEEAKKDDTEDKTDNPEKPIQLYSVIFMSQYGNVPDDIVGLKENDKLTSSQLPKLTTDGYTFAGWYNGETKIEAGYKITGNLKLTGKWDANVYTVKFNANGGSGNMAEMSFNYNEEKALTANAFTRDDYAFAGWAVSADGNAAYTDMGKVKNLTSENNATVTLYAVWTEKDKVLPVVFSLPDGTSVDSGESVTLSCATDGAKICYTIDGVTTEYTSEITITEDVTVTAFATKDGMKDSNVSTASYTVKTYTVTYTTEYAVAPNKISGLKKGYTLTAEQLPELTTDGYTFAGWYNGETKIETGYTITEDLSLTAKWNVNTNTAYTVEHYQQNIADDGYTLVNADTENKTGTTDENTTATAKDYAGFTAKTVEQMKIAADGSTIIKIYYDRNTITLTLNLDGGEGDESITGKYEEAVTIPANPTKTGYTFAGWNPSLPAAFPAENATYTAKWNANTYTAYKVEHYQQNIADDGYTLLNADTENKTGTTDENTSATAKDYAGFTAKTVEQMKIAADGSTVVKIYYDRNTITLTLNLDGGDGETKITGKYGAAVTAPANPAKDGYDFGGWNPELPTTFPADNAEYTATWTVNTYTITYNLNGGTNAQSNPENYTIETETITLENPTRIGYTFLGWYTDESFTTPITEIVKGSTGAKTLYAKWYSDFVYVQGATITGAIPGDGYKDSGIFKAGETVTVGDFYMCDHEVTQAEYETYCSYGETKPSDKSYGVGDDYPVCYVSWYDALVYCNIRSIKEGLTPCYTINGSTNPTHWGSVPTSSDSTWNAVTCDFTANGYRLPTKAEWEYAARGGNGLTGTQYKYAGSNTIGNVAWYTGNSNSKTHEVKGKEPNGLGLYDMSGNVWEWCWDSSDSGNRYRRGGSWDMSEGGCTVSYLYSYYAYFRYNNYGFRVVRTVE